MWSRHFLKFLQHQEIVSLLGVNIGHKTTPGLTAPNTDDGTPSAR